MAVFNILHKKAKFVIVPYAALTPNFPLQLKGDTLAFHDGYNAEVIDACEIHLVNAEQMILKTYGMDAWSYVKLWHKTLPYMDSMTLIKIQTNAE